MSSGGLCKTLVVGIILIVFSSSTIKASFCTEQYTCLSTCSKLVKYYNSCGWFGWASCTAYRLEQNSCYATCSREVCCPGYTGYFCNTPLCFGSTTCNNGGTCISPDNCSCRTGFQGTRCTDIDECQTLTHGCKQHCDNTLGSYQCGCWFGYILGSDKMSCIAMDSCSYNNGGCQHVCSENNNVFSCSCRNGFMLNLDRYSCSDVDECVLSTAGCEHWCMNTIGSFLCYCYEGYSLAVDRKSCNENDECQFNNGGCTSSCVNEPGSYRCTCNAGYQLDADRHTCSDIDECGLSINGCSQICNNTFGSFFCSCADGYNMSNDGQTCLDIDDCVGKLCSNSGTCLDKLASYICLCKDGFTGQHCESDVNECKQLNGGCQDLCMNTNGSFRCSCFENRTLRADGIACSGGGNSNDTVFKRNFIPRDLLPRPCFSVLLTTCKDGGVNEIHLSSTSEWLSLTTNQSIKYTYGIVFSEVSNIFIPISLQGVTVVMDNSNFKMINGVPYKPGDGSFVHGTYVKNCSDYDTRPSDIFEFISADSFIKTFLRAIAPALPSWIGFEKSSTEAMAVQDMKANLIYGKDIDSVSWCAGAPVINDHIYSIFVYNSDFDLSIYGKDIQLKKSLQEKKFCLIVDMCISDGGTLFLMSPDGSQDWLLNIDVFKNLYEHNNIMYKPRGIGLSLGAGINVADDVNPPLLWNGDVMFRPIFREANLWMSGTMIKRDTFFTTEGNAEVFYNISDIQTLMTTMFTAQMDSVSIFHLTSSPLLRFDLFGKSYEIRITLASLKLQTYTSFGGVIQQWCGTQSNPDGVFFTALVTVNPFQGVPILQDWGFNSESLLYGFVTSDMNRNAIENVDITTDIIALQSELELFLTYLDQMIQTIRIFSSDTQVIVYRIREDVLSMKHFITENSAKITGNDIAETQMLINTLFLSLSKIKADVDAFQDATEFITSLHNLTSQITSVTNIMKEYFYSTVIKLNTRITTSSAGYTSFGLKYAPSISVFGMTFPFEIDVEIVYSSGGLFQCSRFDKVSQLLKGERALRFLGRLSKKASYKLNAFLTIDHVGFGIGGAFSMSSENAIVQFNAFFGILGTKVTADIFLTKQGLYTYLEANIWDIFLAQLNISAEIGKKWYELIYRIEGKFVASARKKRQIQTVSTDFHRSYADALEKTTKMIADTAESRLTGVQDSLTKAQNAVTNAQQWVKEKQVLVMSANSAFDQAVAKLDDAKIKLEQAKKPFEEALKKLSDAQKNVDNLCSIKTCNMVCVPGLKAKVCYLGWMPYPCFETTDCMFKIPDIICEIANAGCKVIRAAAFGALELAKIFVKIPIAALDIAKEAVSFAQVVVDKSRALLLGAKGLLEIANVGLEFVKGGLEAAKIALEAVKVVVGAAAHVVEFVIEFGLKNIVDVRNCGFSIEVSTIDLPVFDVSCEVNAFRLGWQTVTLTINFKNIVQSIWQAARATIDAIIKTIGKVFSGRKRREITFQAASKMHAFMRKVRSTNDAFEQLNQTIVLDQMLHNNTLQNNDYKSRVLLFKQKCLSITKIQSFMKDSFGQLWKVANESKKHVDVVNAKKDELLQNNINTIANTLTLENMGISTYYATLDYNLSRSDLDKILDDIKDEILKNQFLAEINNATSLSLENITAESDSMNQINFIGIWLNEMANSSSNFFNESECVDFRDCIFYSISELYNLYEDENLPHLEMIKNTLMELENILLDILQNESSSIENAFISLDFVKEQVNKLINMNVFCSKPPQFTTILSNQTAVEGSIVTFRCQAKGDPEPQYWWYRDEEIIVGQESNELLIGNISAEHVAVYRCMTGNIVANQTSVDAYLTVLPSKGDLKRQLFAATYNVSLPDEYYLGDVASYKEVEMAVNESLTAFYKQHMTETFDIEISQLQPGSIVVEYVIVFNGTSIAAGESLVFATVSLSNGANLVYQGQTVFVHMDTYGTGPDPCNVYSSILGSCEEGFECVTDAGRATCRAVISSSNSEDTAMRIGVGVGCTIAFVCITVGLVWFIRQKWLKTRRVNSQIFCDKQENVFPCKIANQEGLRQLHAEKSDLVGNIHFSTKNHDWGYGQANPNIGDEKQ